MKTIKWSYLLGVTVLGISGALVLVQRRSQALESVLHKAGVTAHPKGTLTFTKDIAPIVYQNCTSCHRQGEIGPFALQSYADVKKHARQIALVTHSRQMPPWKADPNYGEFQDARRLTDDQLDTIQQWAEEGAKEGNSRDLPLAPKFPTGWTMGEPDAVFSPDESYTLEAEGADVYRCFVLPTHFAEDRYLTAMEVRPGNSKIVHHVIAFLDTSGQARKLDAADPGPGYSSRGGGIGLLPSGAIGGWAPGNMPHPLPAGVGTLLPKGADIVLQVHYHKSGKPETDRTKLGLYFTKTPVDKRLRATLAINPFIRIPPGNANYTLKAARDIPTNVTVLQVMPHMHLLGREMTVTANLPDGSTKPLVRVPDWDFNWQTTYTLKEPLKLPAGSKIDMVARYDNSTSNPHNPSSPPRQVTWGEQTTDEMCIAFVFYTVDTEQLTKGIQADGMFEFSNLGKRARLGPRLRELLKNRN